MQQPDTLADKVTRTLEIFFTPHQRKYPLAAFTCGASRTSDEVLLSTDMLTSGQFIQFRNNKGGYLQELETFLPEYNKPLDSEQLQHYENLNTPMTNLQRITWDIDQIIKHADALQKRVTSAGQVSNTLVDLRNAIVMGFGSIEQAVDAGLLQPGTAAILDTHHAKESVWSKSTAFFGKTVGRTASAPLDQQVHTVAPQLSHKAYNAMHQVMCTYLRKIKQDIVSAVNIRDHQRNTEQTPHAKKWQAAAELYNIATRLQAMDQLEARQELTADHITSYNEARAALQAAIQAADAHQGKSVFSSNLMEKFYSALGDRGSDQSKPLAWAVKRDVMDMATAEMLYRRLSYATQFSEGTQWRQVAGEDVVASPAPGPKV